MHKPARLSALLAAAALTFSATPAAAHCCHDDRSLEAAEQSGGLRRGVHGMGSGLTDESVQSDAPTIGGGLRRGSGSLRGGGTGSLGSGGLGQMQGGSIGSYGGGSVGERGPGGLGSMQNGGLGPQAPRPR